MLFAAVYYQVTQVPNKRRDPNNRTACLNFQNFFGYMHLCTTVIAVEAGSVGKTGFPCLFINQIG